MKKINISASVVIVVMLILRPNLVSAQTASPSDSQPEMEKGIVDQSLDQLEKAGRAFEEGRDEFYAHPLDITIKAGEWFIDNAPEAWDWSLQKISEFEQAKEDFWNGRGPFWEAFPLPQPPNPNRNGNGSNPTSFSSQATVGDPIQAEDVQLPPDGSTSSPRPINFLDSIDIPRPKYGWPTPINISGARGQASGSPAGPQFGPPKPGDPMPPAGSGKESNKGGVYGPENPDGSWPSQSNPQGAFGAFDNFNRGPKALLDGDNTPTAAFDSGPQSRNMGSDVFTVDKPVEADGYKSGPEGDQ